MIGQLNNRGMIKFLVEEDILPTPVVYLGLYTSTSHFSVILFSDSCFSLKFHILQNTRDIKIPTLKIFKTLYLY